MHVRCFSCMQWSSESHFVRDFNLNFNNIQIYQIQSWIKEPVLRFSLQVTGNCGGDEKNEWSHRTDKSRTLKNQKKIIKKWQLFHVNQNIEAMVDG